MSHAMIAGLLITGGIGIFLMLPLLGWWMQRSIRLENVRAVGRVPVRGEDFFERAPETAVITRPEEEEDTDDEYEWVQKPETDVRDVKVAEARAAYRRNHRRVLADAELAEMSLAREPAWKRSNTEAIPRVIDSEPEPEVQTARIFTDEPDLPEVGDGVTVRFMTPDAEEIEPEVLSLADEAWLRDPLGAWVLPPDEKTYLEIADDAFQNLVAQGKLTGIGHDIDAEWKSWNLEGAMV